MSNEIPRAWAVKEKLWSLARSAVAHEDGLVNQRLTWLISSHWFLIGVFTALQAGLFANKANINRTTIVVVEVFLIVLSSFAIWMCRVVSASVESALEHLKHIRDWWYSLYPEERLPSRAQVSVTAFPTPRKSECPLPDHYNLKRFPPIMGDFGFDFRSGTSVIPFILLYLDLVIILVAAVCGLLLNADLVVEQSLWTQAPISVATAAILACPIHLLWSREGMGRRSRSILFAAIFVASWLVVVDLIWLCHVARTPKASEPTGLSAGAKARP